MNRRKTTHFRNVIYILLLTVLAVSCSDSNGGNSSSDGDGDGTAATGEPRIYITRNASPVYSGTGPYPFGNVLPGQSSNPVTFAITNSGGQELVIESVSITGDNPSDFSHDFSGVTNIAAGESLELTCTFSPSTSIEGPRYAQLNIVHNDSTATSPYVIKIQGFVAVSAPEISVQDATNSTLLSGSGTKHFGSTSQGGAALTETFTVKNSGNTDLSLDPNGDGLPDISISDTVNFTLTTTSTATSLTKYGEAGSSTTFLIQLNSTNSGYHTATVTIGNSDTDESSYTFTVTGNVKAAATVAPEINVKIEGVNYANSSTYAFGSVLRNTSSGAATFTIQNLGNATLTISSITPSAAPFTYGGTPGASLAPGASTTFTVAFDPTAGGGFGDSVVINNNDGDEGAYTINLSGTGVEPNVNVLPNSAPELYGTHNVGTSTPLTFTVQNTGSSPLNISSISLGGADPGQFVISSYPASQILAGQSSTMIVSFVPTDSTITANTTYNSQIDIASDDIDNPTYSVTIQGVGAINPDLTMTSAPTDFGSSNEGVTGTTYTYTIQNTGTTDLTITTPVVMNSTAAAAGTNFDVMTQPGNTVTPGSTTSFTARFDPQLENTGALNDTIQISNNDTGTENIFISGTSVNLSPSINVRVGGLNYSDGTTYGFGNVSNLTTSQATFTIENNGTYSMDITAISEASARFSKTGGATTIAAGGSYTFTTTYDPTGVAAGAHGPDALEITWEDASLAAPPPNTYTINLTGTGIAPDIDISESGNNITDASTYTLLAAQNIAVGSSGTSVPITITNNGSDTLTISSVVLSDTTNFSLDYPPSSTIPSGGGTSQFAFSFNPTITGNHNTTITITCNDDPNDAGTEETFTFDFQAGTFVGDPNRILTMIAEPKEFGSVPQGSSGSAQTFVLRNDGTTDLQITNITFTNEGAGNDYLATIGVSGDFGATFPGTPVDIAPGATKSFNVTFQPQVVGNNLASNVNITHNGTSGATTPSPYTFSLRGDGVNAGAVLSMISAPTFFGDVDVGSTNILTFTVKNTGSTPLDFTGGTPVTVTDAVNFAVTQPLTDPLPQGDSTTFTVTYQPQTAATHSTNIQIASNDSASPQVIPISGNGIGVPDITTAATLAFGNTNVSANNDQNFAIQNDGGDVTEVLTVSGFAITGTDASMFSVNVDPSPLPINGGGASDNTLQIRFTPTSAGAKNATLYIYSDDPDESIKTVNLTGTGVGSPTIAVTGSNPYDFGNVLTGTSSSPYTYTINNTGTANLDITSVSLIGADAAEFALFGEPTGAVSVTSGNAISFSVTHSPVGINANAAQIRITHNDPVAGTNTDIDLTGQGIEPDITVAATLAFGNTNISANNDQNFAIQNDGNDVTAILNVSNFSIGGTDASMFSVNVDPSPLPINGGGASDNTLQIRFTPTSAGAKNATLYIYSDDPDESIKTVNLTGTGVAPNITVNPLSITDQLVGTSTIYNVTVNNTTTDTLNVTGSSATITGTDSSSFTLITNNDFSIVGVGNNNTDIALTFNPTSTGVKTATINIPSDDPDTPSYALSLTGTSISSTTIDDPAADAVIRGEYSRVAVGASGAIYAVYYDQTNTNLIFAKSTDYGANWTIKTDVDVAGIGNDIGKFCDIYVSEPDVFVSYYDDTNDNLKMAFSGDSGTNWTVETAGELDTSVDNIGQYTSITGDGTNIYIAYYDITNTNLKVAFITQANIAGANSWTIRTDSVNHGIGANDVGKYTSIHANANYVHISHVDDTTGNLLTTRYDVGGTTWNDGIYYTLDTATTNPYEYTSISGMGTYVYVSYFDADTNDLKMATSMDNGANWSNEFVVQKPITIGRYNSIIVDSYGDIHISYYDESNNRLKHAWFDGSWIFSTVNESTADVGRYSSIGYLNDDMYILFYNNDTVEKDLIISKSTDGGANW